jgi:ABC-type transport system involved in multi-copper enzyme maturation permease subunit
MAIVYILCISVSLLVFGNEHSNHTMKNTVTYGIPRGNIYFGKIFVQIMYAIIAFAIIAGVHVSSSYLLLENSASNDLNIYIRTFLACLPFFVFGLACANTFSFILEGSGGAVAASSGIMLAFPLVCNLLGMKFEVFAELGKLLPANIINFTHYDAAAEAMIMYWDTSAGFANCWLYGMVQTIIIVTIGYLLFRRKEIK